MTYKFEVDGETIEVDWETMMSKDAMGYIILDDGRVAREVKAPFKMGGRDETHIPTDREILSDTLGFVQDQYDEMEAHRKMHGFSGIEFVRDERVPEYFHVKAKAGKEWDDYLKSRGFYDKNRHDAGYTLPPSEIKKAENLVKRNFSS